MTQLEHNICSPRETRRFNKSVRVFAQDLIVESKFFPPGLHLVLVTLGSLNFNGNGGGGHTNCRQQIYQKCLKPFITNEIKLQMEGLSLR